MSDHIRTLLAPGCALDSHTEVADPADMDAAEIGSLVLLVLEHLHLVPVKVRHKDNPAHHYELMTQLRAAERYFAHRPERRPLAGDDDGR